MRAQVRSEEVRRAGLPPGAQELLHPLAAIVRGPLLEAVRPAVDLDAPIDARLAQRLLGHEPVGCRAVVELHEEGGAEHVAAVIGDQMAIADDALAETLDVAFS